MRESQGSMWLKTAEGKAHERKRQEKGGYGQTINFGRDLAVVCSCDFGSELWR